MLDTQSPACNAFNSADSHARSLSTEHQESMRSALSSGDHREVTGTLEGILTI